MRSIFIVYITCACENQIQSFTLPFHCHQILYIVSPHSKRMNVWAWVNQFAIPMLLVIEPTTSLRFKAARCMRYLAKENSSGFTHALRHPVIPVYLPSKWANRTRHVHWMELLSVSAQNNCVNRWFLKMQEKWHSKFYFFIIKMS